MQNPEQSPFNSPQPQPPAGGPPVGGSPSQIPGADKKLIAGLCGILLGAFGVHKFILGYNTEGIIMLAVSLVGGLLTCGIVSGIVGIFGLVEGILYLTKTDQQFVDEYITSKKPWF